MEEYMYKFQTVQLKERADSVNYHAERGNDKDAMIALNDIELLIGSIKKFLNDKRNVARGEEKSFNCVRADKEGKIRCEKKCSFCKEYFPE